MLPRKKKSELEDYLKQHIGKAIENGHIADYLITMGLALFGYKAYGLSGIVIGPVAYKLATAPSEVAAGSGILVLGHMGLTELGLFNHLYEYISQLPIIGEAGEGLKPPWWWPVKAKESGEGEAKESGEGEVPIIGEKAK